jgi:LuxR family transcriptional regulator, maltose regulon positive regulatory protein
MLSRKIRPPGLPRGTTTRGRLDRLYSELLERHEALAVLAAAGSGKTVQTQLFLTGMDRRFGWLTLDEADRSGSRLLTYLADALEGMHPGAGRAVRSQLDNGFSLPEVAASLAEGLRTTPGYIVFDDCERVADASEAADVLTAFLDYLPPKVQAILLSRMEFEVPITRMLTQGRIGRISGAELALDMDEARAVVGAHDGSTVDLDGLMESTRGWVAAVAFNVRADLGPLRGPDALARYLSEEVFAALPPDEQSFVLRTSMLDTVSARGAAAMCGGNGHALWRSVCSRHLPATLTPDRELVYHPKFREFLLEQLRVHHSPEIPDLHRRHAQHLAHAGAYEDAVAAALAVDDLDLAVTFAEHAVSELCERADWRVLDRWLCAFGESRIASAPGLRGAQIRSYVGQRRLTEASNIIRRLIADGTLQEVARHDPGVMAYVGWTFQWQPRFALDVMRIDKGDYRADAVRYELRVLSGREAVEPPSADDWSDMERIMSWGLLLQGRLDALARMLPDRQDWPPRSFFRTPHPLLGLIWRGEVERARALFDQVPAATVEGAHTDLWFFHEAWLHWAEGDLSAALRAAERAVDHSRKTRFGWEPCFQVVVGYMLIELDRLDDARCVLADSISRSASAGTRAYVEWAQTFQGLAFLRGGRNRDAVRVLRSAVAGMERARRDLLLPMAAAFLSEAEHRAGELSASERAAERAMATAADTGSFFLLRRALTDVPGVLKRQHERRTTDERWRRLSGARSVVVAREPRSPVESTAPHILVQTFGPDVDILRDGVPLNVRRLKVLELASSVTLHRAGISRQRLQLELFPDADQRRGGNYFRQVVHKLRQVTGITLERTADGCIAWPADVNVTSTDVEVEQTIASSRGLSGRDRLDELRRVADLANGSYLPASELDWVEVRRAELLALSTGATTEASMLAAEFGDTDLADELARRAVALDPCAEAAYGVLIDIALRRGHPDDANTIYGQLCAALSELGLSPTQTTRTLLRGVPEHDRLPV